MFEVLINSLNTLLVTSLCVERITEIVKGFYLPIKNRIFKKNYTEISTQEKQAISLIISMIICFSLSISFYIPNVTSIFWIQQLLASAVASVGSNMIHSILGVVIAIKDNLNQIKK